jgi:predicted small secreted protein
MTRAAILILFLAVVICGAFGCNTAKGVKGDVTYIGDKTAEILDAP